MPLVSQIGYLLRDRDQTEVVLAGAARHGGEEGAAFRVAQQRPGLVDDQQAGASLAAHARPHPAGDQVDGQGP